MGEPQPLSRRSFLRQLAWATGGLMAASLPLAGCARATYPPDDHTLRFFSPKQFAVLDAATRRLVPSGPGRLGAGDVGVAKAADALFSTANRSLQADLKKLLDTFEDMPCLSLHFRPFTTMGPAEQDAYLAAWMKSPFGLQRQGFVALDKIAAMLFYMDERSWPQIGFAGPWVGKLDVGLGPDNQGDLAGNPNPNVFKQVSG